MPRWSTTPRKMVTPWGKADQKQRLEEGIYKVSTPSHGGYMIGKNVARFYLSEAARRHAMQWANWYCFEEDCQWAILAAELPGKYLKGQGITKPSLTDITTLQAQVQQTLEHYYPEYLSEAEQERMAQLKAIVEA